MPFGSRWLITVQSWKRLSVSLRRSEQRGALFVPDALEMNPLRNDPTFIL